MHDAPAQSRLAARDVGVRRVFWITLFLNFLVAGGKGAYGLFSGSVALGADAFHSVLDGAANVLALVGMRLAAAPASPRHPYGRRKIELLAALGVGVLITAGLLEVGAAAVSGLWGRRPPPDIGWPGFAVVLGSMAVNFLVARFEARKGRELASPLLAADARHTESDLYASAAVLLSFLGVRQGFSWADGACGLVVVALVGHVAWSVFRENVPMLIDAAVLDPEQVAAIGAAVSGVRGIHGIRSRGTRWAVELDLHVLVAADMQVDAAHRIAARVEDDLRAALPQLCDVVVHIEPETAEA